MRSATILAAAIALAGASPAAAAPAWLPPNDLSPAGGSARVAVNPAGDAVAVWEQFDGRNGIVRAVTRRAGEPFSGAIDLSRPGDDASGAQVALDEAGNALVVWHRGGILQATMRPPGGRFAAPENLSLVGERASSVDLAMDRSGNAVVVWLQGGSGPIKAALRPAGGTFSSPVDVSAIGVNVSEPKVAIDATGGAVAVWRRTTGTSAAIQHAIRPAGGVFSAPADLSAPNGIANTPQLAMDAAGHAVAVWQARNGIFDQIQAASRQPGAGFSSLEPLSVLSRNAQTPQVAVGPGGSAVVAWARETAGAPVGPYEIQAVTRTADGSFSPVADLSGSAPGGPSVMPQVDMDAAGDAVVVWRRYDAMLLPRVEGVVRPAGRAFSRPRELSAPQSYAIGQAAAIDDAGNALAVWTAFVPGSSSSRIQAAVYDATAPRLDALSIPASGVAGVPVSFSASPFDAWSSVSGAWAFGDGATASGPAAEHTYLEPGSYRVGITVSDAAGTAIEDSREITIAPPLAGRAPPVISRLRIAPPAFSRRARVSYRLDRAAKVRFRVLRRSGGVRRGFVRASPAGRNRFRLRRGRRLRPGRYRLTAVPVAGGIRGRRAGATFRIVAGGATSRAGS